MFSMRTSPLSRQSCSLLKNMAVSLNIKDSVAKFESNFSTKIPCGKNQYGSSALSNTLHFFGLYAIAGYAGVGNEGIDIECRKGRDVFGVSETFDNGFFLFLAGGQYRHRCHHYEHDCNGKWRNPDRMMSDLHNSGVLFHRVSVSANGFYRTTSHWMSALRKFWIHFR